MAFNRKQETVSPLLSRIQKQEQLTIKNLAYHVPRIQKAKEASHTLHEETDLSEWEKDKLSQLIREGESSKEELTLMALPLVATIARKELKRRTAWNTRVTLDDMIQEGMGGFLRGIDAYNVTGNQTSPTNYLGQWILSHIRRHVETLEHDFSIPHETMERYRKIRAIRSVLFNKLGRNPTDQEIVDYANLEENQPQNKMGRVNKVASSKKLTLKHVLDEKQASLSTGKVESIAGFSDDESGEYEKSSTSFYDDDSATGIAQQQDFEEQSARKALAVFFEKIFKHMRMGEIQEDIIRQKFGFPPYKDEIPMAGIALNSQVSKYKVNLVIEAFTKEMSSSDSIFHREVSALSYDELDSFNMSWVSSVLGEYTGKTSKTIDPVLTQNMKPSPKKPKKSFGERDRPIQYNHEAIYTCEDGHKTSIYLISQHNKLRSKPKCYTCGGHTVFTSIKSFDKNDKK